MGLPCGPKTIVLKTLDICNFGCILSFLNYVMIHCFKRDNAIHTKSNLLVLPCTSFQKMRVLAGHFTIAIHTYYSIAMTWEEVVQIQVSGLRSKIDSKDEYLEESSVEDAQSLSHITSVACCLV